MSINQEWQRGLARIAATSPEQAMVKNYAPLVSNYVQAIGQRELQGLQQSTYRRGVENTLANERADIRVANRDAAFALPLGVGNVGLSVLGAHENAVQTHHAELQAKAYQDLLDSMITIIKAYPDEFTARINGVHPDQQPKTVPAPAPMASLPSPERDPLFEGRGIF